MLILCAFNLKIFKPVKKPQYMTFIYVTHELKLAPNAHNKHITLKLHSLTNHEPPFQLLFFSFVFHFFYNLPRRLRERVIASKPLSRPDNREIHEICFSGLCTSSWQLKSVVDFLSNGTVVKLAANRKRKSVK